jgi:hypothetical protein
MEYKRLMTRAFDDLMNGLDEVDSFLAGKTTTGKGEPLAEVAPKNVADELVEAMREAADIAQGTIRPAAVHRFRTS